MTSKVNTGFPPLDTQLAVPEAYFQISNSLSGKINKQTKNNNKTPPHFWGKGKIVTIFNLGASEGQRGKGDLCQQGNTLH